MSEHAVASTWPPPRRAARSHLGADPQGNVGSVERVLSVLGGGALALYGMRRSLGALMLMLGGGALMYRGLTGYCPIYQAMGVDPARHDPERGITFEAAMTVHKPAAEVYRFWSQVENYPRFLRHLESVVNSGEKRSRWAARGPLYLALTWDAELVEARQNALLSWRSLPGADVDNVMTVRLRELSNDRGTEVRLRLAYAPPGGVAGMALARLFKSLTARQLHEDFRHCKHLMEAGEIPTIANQPAAPASPLRHVVPGREERA